MDYVGYNGTITVVGDALFLTHHGLPARAGGLVTERPRRIPLPAVSDARLKSATRLSNGCLTLGLGGARAVEVRWSTAASHPETIMFRHKDNHVFASLHQWLLTVVAHNRQHGVDPTMVAFDAEPTRMDPVRERTESAPERAASITQATGASDERGSWIAAVSEERPVSGPQEEAGDQQPGRTPAHRLSPSGSLGTAVQPWARASVWQNAVGENNYQQAFAKLLRRNRLRAGAGDYGTELDGMPAAVVAEPGNPYDPNAVMVLVQNELVGYLPRDAAALYSAPLRDLAERGEYLAISARVWVAPREDRRAGSVTVVLPPPDGVQSFNEPPEAPHAVLPAGGAIQVTGEEDHMDVLTRYLSDRERYLAVTLHIVEEQKTVRSQPYRAVEVRLDGARVGVLTKAMSDKLTDLIDYIAGRDLLPVCRAVLKGSPLRAELVPHTAKAHNVTRKWLESFGDTSATGGDTGKSELEGPLPESSPPAGPAKNP